MKYPVATLQNLYYFVRDGVVYNISSTDDADGCGVNPLEDVTGLKKRIENRIKAAGTSEWSKSTFANKSDEEKSKYIILRTETETGSTGGQIEYVIVYDLEACAAVFPCIKVCYEYDVLTMGATTTNKRWKYYFMQNSISDGDKYASDKFTPYSKSGDGHSSKTTYPERLKEWAEGEAGRLAAGGASHSTIMSSFPYYLTTPNFIASAGKTVKLEGVYAKSLTVNPVVCIDEDSISNYVKTYAKNKAEETAKSILDRAGVSGTVTVTVS